MVDNEKTEIFIFLFILKNIPQTFSYEPVYECIKLLVLFIQCKDPTKFSFSLITLYGHYNNGVKL
jgi:hypothetical protein